MFINDAAVDRYMRDLRDEFPRLKISREKPWWLRVVFRLPGIKKLRWNRATQTIGMNIWLSDDWDNYSPFGKLSVLRHERQHLLWFRDHTTILASILYLFFIFPIGLAYYRAVFERAGYRENICARVESFGPSDGIKSEMREMYLSVFCGWMYMKMWPFKKTILRWFEEDWARAVELYA